MVRKDSELRFIRLSENDFADLTAGRTPRGLSRLKIFAGGADRVRTDDLRLAKPALSQLSYSPTPCGSSRSLIALVAARPQPVGCGLAANQPASAESGGPGKS